VRSCGVVGAWTLNAASSDRVVNVTTRVQGRERSLIPELLYGICRSAPTHHTHILPIHTAMSDAKAG
jgi:hypothetical protein